MNLTLQATVSCHACGEKDSPVNAVVEQVPCVACGAKLELPDAVWRGALEGLVHRAASLAENARGHETLRTRGGVFRVGYARTPARCPHCEATWDTLPNDQCPACSVAVLRRSPPHAVEGVEALLAEDRALVDGADVDGLGGTIACGSCAAPIDVGEDRRVQCTACDAQTVVPDEVWRRANAPALAARWVVELDTEGSDQPLAELYIGAMAVGPDGTVFVVGSEYPVDSLITALDAGLTQRLWTHELSGDGEHQPVPLPDGRVLLVPTTNGTTVHVADADGVQPFLDLGAGAEIEDGTLHGDTLLLARAYNRQLHRYDLQGSAVPLWPPVGFFARIFGGGDGPIQPDVAPTDRPVGTLAGRIGSGHDGALLVTWGGKVIRYDPDGKIVWTVTDPDWMASLIAPAGTASGQAWIGWFAREGEGSTNHLVRIDAGGSSYEKVLQLDAISAMAVTPEGHVLVRGGNHVEDVGTVFEVMELDAEGLTVRTLPCA